MGYVHCPFCGARVSVGSDGSVEPKCPRCGAWAVAAGAGDPTMPPELHGHADLTGSMGATMALETRGVAGPTGEVAFVRAPYAGEVPDGLDV